MSEQAQSEDDTPIKQRLRRVMREVRVGNYRELAAKVQEYIGSGTTAARVTGWSKGDGDPKGLALIALLHESEPRACFEYLVGKRASLPRIRVYSQSNSDQVLDALCSMLKASGACVGLATTEEALDLLRGTNELQELIDQEVKRRAYG